MHHSTLEYDLQTAVYAAREAGQILLKNISSEIKINSSIDKDIKLEADVISERLIIDILKERTSYAILSEETGLFNNVSEYRWIVDPLDGSLNYSRGIEIFAVSIGLWKNDTPLLGVVYDFLKDRTYYGIVGNKAYCNQQPLHVSNVFDKKDSVLTTGFPVYSSFDKTSLETFVVNLQDFKKVRLLGSAAVSLVHVAKGSVEAYMENNIAIWDVAAGLAIVLAAGGQISVTQGKGPHFLNVYASNGLI
jgi:myo-inositol-1(or 4)-monophosphatase